MNKCKHCGVFLEDSLKKCPLCHRAVEEFKEGNKNSFYPVYNTVNTEPHLGIRGKIILFVSVTIISICVLVNLFTGVTNPWFIYVACSILYLLLLINNTILSKMHAGTKILLQILSISGLLFVYDLLSGFYRWSVNVVIPFLFIAGTFLITIIVLKKKMLWSEYVGYIIAMIFLGFMPMILYFTGVADELWASAVSALYSFLTIIGMLLFANKKFKNEVVRRFHF